MWAACCGQLAILLGDKGELQVGEMVIDGAEGWPGTAARVVFSHGIGPPLVSLILRAGGLINAEIRGWRLTSRRSFAAGEMEGTGFGVKRARCSSEVGDVFGGKAS